MPLRFRKSIKVGPARINLSKRGVGGSIGAGGLRYGTGPRRRKAKSSCCLNTLILLPVLLPMALIKRAIAALRS